MGHAAFDPVEAVQAERNDGDGDPVVAGRAVEDLQMLSVANIEPVVLIRRLRARMGAPDHGSCETDLLVKFRWRVRQYDDARVLLRKP